MVSEDVKTQLTLGNQEERERHPSWNNLYAAANRHRINEDTMQIESAIAQHLVDESDFNFAMMYLLNHFPEQISQLGNI